jgi:hypothetical protein
MYCRSGNVVIHPHCIYQPKHEYVPTAHTIMTDIPLPWTQGLGHASQTCHHQPWQQVWVKTMGIDGCSMIGVARKVSKYDGARKHRQQKK